MFGIICSCSIQSEFVYSVECGTRNVFCDITNERTISLKILILLCALRYEVSKLIILLALNVMRRSHW